MNKMNKKENKENKGKHVKFLIAALSFFIVLIAMLVFYYPKPKEFPKKEITQELYEGNNPWNFSLENNTAIVNNILTNITTMEKTTNEEGDEFYMLTKPHWTHMPLKYFITNEKECGSYEVNKVKKGFKEIVVSTKEAVDFIKTANEEDADIIIKCSFIKDCYTKKIDIENFGDYYTRTVYENICAHKRGIAKITEFTENKIIKAEIELIGLYGFAETNFRGMSGFYIGSCGHATTEIHEILHTFDYGHVNDLRSIMYYKGDGMGYTVQNEGECIGSKLDIDKFIIEDLIETYSK